MTVLTDKQLAKQLEVALNAPAIDLAVDPSRRPLAGLDIDSFRSRHELQIVDAIYILCIQNSAAYNQMLRKPALEYSMEMLIRLYDMYPTHAPWKIISPQQCFDNLYGDVVEQFKGTAYEKEARLALYRRFTAACGRSIYTAYRWIEGEGNSKRGIEKIFSKLSILDNPRQVLEGLAVSMYKSRGVSFERAWPMPTLENPPQPKRRGPPPRAERLAALKDLGLDKTDSAVKVKKEKKTRKPRASKAPVSD